MSLPISSIKQWTCKQSAVRAVRFNIDGNYCITCGADKTLKLWNPYTTVLLQTYLGHGYEVLDAQSSCDNSHIASGGMDKTVFLWDVSTSHAVRRFRGHAGYVNALKFNEESTVILSASVDGSIRAWDCRSKSRDPIQIMKDAKDSVTSVHVSDHEILTCSLDGCVRIYDLRKGKLFQDSVGCSLTCVSLTREGQGVLVSSLDNTVRLLDKVTGDVLSTFTGHKNETYRIDSCLSYDDFYVISGSEDGFVYCWDMIQGTVKEKLKHKESKVAHSLSFHPTKSIMLTASGTDVYLWCDSLYDTEDT